MNIHLRLPLLSLLVVTCLGLPASAADRMRAGQWVGTTIVGSRTFPTTNCLTQSDADAINGDAKSIRAYLEKIIPSEICKISDVKVDGSQVVYTATCSAHPPKIVTTSYHGDSSQGTDSTGSKIDAKLSGPCK